MQYLTWSEVKTKVQEKIDIADEVFITPAELLRYCHDAIDYCEAEIHKFNAEDRYFETVYPIQLVSGVQDYQLPPNIYANKIRKFLRTKNNDYYEISRLTNLQRYLDAVALDYGGSSADYRYMLLNNSANTKPIIRLFPRSGHTVASYSTLGNTTAGSNQLTVGDATGLQVGQFIVEDGTYGATIPEGARIEVISGATITMNCEAVTTGEVTCNFIDSDYVMYYIRNANKPSALTDYVDIPEFSSFIVQWMIVECLKKDTGNPRLADEKERLQELKDQMTATLGNMIIDQRDKIEVDNVLTWEMS